MYGIIASILHMGNVDFTEKETGHSGDGCVIVNSELTDHGQIYFTFNL